jgi:colicin import membrane protein
LGAEEQQNTSRDQNEWAGQLVAAITRAWNRVEGGPGLHCSVRINLSLTGEVLSATIAKSSGNIQFDNSATRAVLKASPLPLPRNRAAFDSNVNL